MLTTCVLARNRNTKSHSKKKKTIILHFFVWVWNLVVSLKEEHGLNVFKNRALRIINIGT